MAYCGQCGAQVPEGAAFCASCGAATSVAQQQQQRQQTQQQQQWKPRTGGYKNWTMKKKALATIVVLVLVIMAFAWCGGGNSNAPSGNTGRSNPSAKNQTDSVRKTTPSGTPSGVKKAPSSAVVKAGDMVQLGRRQWRVLDVQDGKALVLLNDLLGSMQYHSRDVRITWENSDMRAYLNGKFYEETFTAEEKKRIAETTVINNNNPRFGTSGGNNTIDKVFLLSVEEAERYFSTDWSRRAGGGYYWWLRTPSQFADAGPAVVRDDGTIDAKGSGTSLSMASQSVRPALWLTINP